VDYVALERGDRTATKPVFPADTGKTDHQKDRIILSLLYKFLPAFSGGFRKSRACSFTGNWVYFENVFPSGNSA
jgi:hypothetical protein